MFVYAALYLTLTLQWLQEPGTKLAVLYGLSLALVGLNIQHDANHGAVSKRPWINDLLGYGADLLGNTKWIWIQQHWTHHAFTNNIDKDPDVVAAEPLMIFHDYPIEHPSRRWYHAYQFVFYLPTFCGYWLSTVVSWDVLTLQHKTMVAKGQYGNRAYLGRKRSVAVLLRLFHLTITVGSPVYHAGGLTLAAVGNALLVGATGGLLLGILFSLSHNFEGSDREPLTTTSNKKHKVCWYKSQVETSSTYGGLVAGCLTGGLNFQIEHHLFPRMSSAWYPYIAPTVRSICQKHGVRYTYYPWFHQNLASFFRYLCSTGNSSNSTKEEQSLESQSHMSGSFLVATVAALCGVMWAMMELNGGKFGTSTAFLFNTTV